MADERVYGGSDMPILLQEEGIPCSSEVLESLWMPSSSASFQGSESMVNFGAVGGRDLAERPLMQAVEKEENNDEIYCGGKKKRRLRVDQVQFLERNFEVENKLEPERKVQLAKDLGLQPRQVAIWFQNRRARFKTKQMEKDYGLLKASYDKLKTDHSNILKEKENLTTEINALKEKLHKREKGKIGGLEAFEAKDLSVSEQQKPDSNSESENLSTVPTEEVCKQEEANSVKSDVIDSESPRNTENHSSMAEPAESCHGWEPEQSDFSQGEEDNSFRGSLHLPLFLKLEDHCYEDPPPNSCSFGFPAEEQPFCFWTH